jgi:hypothetical protein
MIAEGWGSATLDKMARQPVLTAVESNSITTGSNE